MGWAQLLGVSGAATPPSKIHSPPPKIAAAGAQGRRARGGAGGVRLPPIKIHSPPPKIAAAGAQGRRALRSSSPRHHSRPLRVLWTPAGRFGRGLGGRCLWRSRPALVAPSCGQVGRAAPMGVAGARTTWPAAGVTLVGVERKPGTVAGVREPSPPRPGAQAGCPPRRTLPISLRYRSQARPPCCAASRMIVINQ